MMRGPMGTAMSCGMSLMAICGRHSQSASASTPDDMGKTQLRLDTLYLATLHSDNEGAVNGFDRDNQLLIAVMAHKDSLNPIHASSPNPYSLTNPQKRVMQEG